MKETKKWKKLPKSIAFLFFLYYNKKCKIFPFYFIEKALNFSKYMINKWNNYIKKDIFYKMNKIYRRMKNLRQKL